MTDLELNNLLRPLIKHVHANMVEATVVEVTMPSGALCAGYMIEYATEDSTSNRFVFIGLRELLEHQLIIQVASQSLNACGSQYALKPRWQTP